MTDKEIIEVVQAHNEGKQIQFSNHDSCFWIDCSGNKPEWNFKTTDYRVKPQKKVRPYKDCDECWNDMQNHQPLGWVKDKDSGSYVFYSVISSGVDFENIFKFYTYVDGSPFGIVEDN